MATIKFLKKEVHILHLIMLFTSKIMILLGVILLWTDFGLPYTYVLMFAGFLLLIPLIGLMYREELVLEHWLVKKLRKKGKK